MGEVWELGEEQNHDTNDVLSPSKKTSETPPVRPLPALAGIPVSHVSTGEGHFIVQSATGQLYAWGLNNFGQLGLGDVAPRSHPTLISELHHFIITKVVCGAFHSLVLTSKSLVKEDQYSNTSPSFIDNGKVLVFGNNSVGQLGLGTTDHEPLPKELPVDEKVIDIAAGKRHSIVLTERYAV